MNVSATTASPVERQTYTILEAARILGVGKTSIYESVKRKEIPHVRVGGRIVVPRRVIERMLEGEQRCAN